MSIQRYHFYNIYGTPIPDNKVMDENGDYVLFTDHEAELHKWRQKARVLNRAMRLWRDMYREYKLILNVVREMNIERAEETEAETTRLKRERDEAVEALKLMLRRHGCVKGCCASARAVLAKIGGQG